MNFLTNILRYPRFFISSVLGLFFILVTPLIKVFKEIKNKKLFYILLFGPIGIVIWILYLMTNSNL
jgi:hypothetical protein